MYHAAITAALLGWVEGLRETERRIIGDYFPLALCVFGLPSFLNTRLSLLGQESKKTSLKNKLKGKREFLDFEAAVLGRHLT